MIIIFLEYIGLYIVIYCYLERECNKVFKFHLSILSYVIIGMGMLIRALWYVFFHKWKCMS